MSTTDNREKRLGVDIPQELWFELNDLVTWGNKKHIYTALTRQLVDLLRQAQEKEGTSPRQVVAMVVEDDINAKKLLERTKQKANEAKGSQDLDSSDGQTKRPGARPHSERD